LSSEVLGCDNWDELAVLADCTTEAKLLVAADAEDATLEVVEGAEGVNKKGLGAPEPKPPNPPNFWGS